MHIMSKLTHGLKFFLQQGKFSFSLISSPKSLKFSHLVSHFDLFLATGMPTHQTTFRANSYQDRGWTSQGPLPAVLITAHASHSQEFLLCSEDSTFSLILPIFQSLE